MSAPSRNRQVLEAADANTYKHDGDTNDRWWMTPQAIATLAAVLLGVLWLAQRYHQKQQQEQEQQQALSPDEIRRRRELLLQRLSDDAGGDKNAGGTPAGTVTNKNKNNGKSSSKWNAPATKTKNPPLVENDKYDSKLLPANKIPTTTTNAAETTNTAPTTTTATATAKKVPPNAPPPAQVLCHALSNITQTEVYVVQGPTSWGGQGWKTTIKRQLSSKHTTAARIEIPLLLHSPFSPTSNLPDQFPAWTQLARALHSWLGTTGEVVVLDRNDARGDQVDRQDGDTTTIHSSKHSMGDGQQWIYQQLFPPNHNKNKTASLLSQQQQQQLTTTSLARANVWYTRTKTQIPNYHTGNKNHSPSLADCLRVFQQHLVRVVARELLQQAIVVQQELSKLRQDDDEDIEDHGLFTDDYIGVTTPIAPVVVQRDTKKYGMWNDLLAILKDERCMNHYLAKPFVEALLQQTYILQQNQDQLAASNSHGNLTIWLIQELMTQLPSMPDESKLLHDRDDETSSIPVYAVRATLTALTNLLTLAPASVAQALAEDTLQTLAWLRNNDLTARQLEERSVLRSLFVLAAYTVPHFTKIQTAVRGEPLIEWLPRQFHSTLCHELGEGYPLVLRRQRGKDVQAGHTALKGIQQVAQSLMRQARHSAALAMKRMSTYKPTTRNSNTNIIRKGGLFDWLGYLVRSNEQLMDVLQSDLLSPGGLQQNCSTGPFLLGATSALLCLCGKDLIDHFVKLGHDAFDVRFLEHTPGMLDPQNTTTINNSNERLGILARERRLFASANNGADIVSNTSRGRIEFTGTTECFFLTAALLRVSVFAVLRRVDAYHEKYRRDYTTCYDLARQEDFKAGGSGGVNSDSVRLPLGVMDRFRRVFSADLGWCTFAHDPELMSLVTRFSLLQLEWLVSMANCKTKTGDGRETLSSVPEWFCKLPAQWLANNCDRLTRHDGDKAVQLATHLLHAGTNDCGLVSDAGRHSYHLSPLVLTELIRIAGAFVRSGVSRAKAKHRAKTQTARKPFHGAEDSGDQVFENDDVINERDLDIYTSFDARDLGVTVFSNPFVLDRLCPTLIRTFTALDAVEGGDTEREHRFDKFLVKNEVADLLLRLLNHPSGKCKASMVTNLNAEDFSSFGRSIASAVGLEFDDAYLHFIDAREIATTDPRFSGHFELLANSAAQGFMGTRRLLLLLCSLTKDVRIAAVFGGGVHGETSAASELASMFVNLIDRLISEDGSLQSDIDFTKGSYLGAKQIDRMKYEDWFGLSLINVSVMVHQLLALGARWHLVSSEAYSDGSRSSPFLDALASNELCNIAKLQNALKRFVRDPGYAFTAPGDGQAQKSSFSDSSRRRRDMAKQETMSHEQVEELSCAKDIQAFFNNLGAALAKKATAALCPRLDDEAMKALENKVLAGGACATEDAYTERLGDWVVSSSPFLAGSSSTKFAHIFDAAARSRGLESIGTGKTLVKEARKCTRLIPTPHSNASIFVCFAEERMDLCRAIIVGGCETPYSLGCFEFDVFFPATFPAVPPLAHFKTTGGGQTRLHPNLYNCGKICISVLGTSHAWNESQRWDPATSSLAQVLMSIQSQILGVKDPYYSEGFAHQGLEGTRAGERGSARFNNMIRLHTVRHAIIQTIKFPPVGFEDVVKRHFSLCRKKVLVQARSWLLESEGTPLHERFQKAYSELVVLLSEMSSLPDAPQALPPNDIDLRALESRDPKFVQQHQGLWETTEEEDSKLPAEDRDSEEMLSLEIDHATADYNPWAAGYSGAAANSSQVATETKKSEGTNVDDDEDFYS